MSLGVPISFLGAITLMPGLDVPVNEVSVFAFVLVLGIVVDDAIIVHENIYWRRRSMATACAAPSKARTRLRSR